MGGGVGGWGGGVVQHFPGGSNLFPGGSNFFQGGVQMLILATHRTCDFQGGGADPLSHHSGSPLVTI